MRTYRPIKYRPVRNRRCPSSPIVIEANEARDRYKSRAEKKMRALDSLPAELRKAVTEANYSLWDVEMMASQLAGYPEAGKAHLAKPLIEQLKKCDADLTRQRAAYGRRRV